MKVEILTFHYANNYGALLQCYALSTVLKNNGHDVELLNISPSKKRPSLWTSIRNYLYFTRLNRFRSDFLPSQSKLLNTFEDLSSHAPRADCYIVGSDQVWNPQITKTNSLLYFFNFLPNSTKKIAYAASFGLSNWEPTQYDEDITRSLGKFSSIGVRENSAVQICKDIFGVDSTQVLDPTFLLDNYNAITDLQKSTKGTGLVSYKFDKDKSWYNLLRHISDELSIPSLSLNDNKLHAGTSSSPFTSVGMWLNSIKNSSFVVTDSFHCMVFAIIYKKPFIALPANPKRIGRMLSLLESLGLKDRFYSNYEQIYSSDKWKEKIDFDMVHKKLSLLRKESLEFLYNSLSK